MGDTYTITVSNVGLGPTSGWHWVTQVSLFAVVCFVVDASLSLWRRGDESWPYVSIHVIHALQRARQKDYAVPDEMMKQGQTYRLHISSMDLQHGFSLQPVNMNFQILPGYDHVLTISPTSSGDFSIICNEFCGIGHHMMTGKIHVKEPQKRAEAAERLAEGR